MSKAMRNGAAMGSFFMSIANKRNKEMKKHEQEIECKQKELECKQRELAQVRSRLNKK